MNATAFGRSNPFGSKLNAIFSSDIGHFDVIDMRHPLPEAYELVEDGHITADNFRDFTFANAVKLWGTQNPKFFEGTRVAKEAAALLAAQTPTLPPPSSPDPPGPLIIIIARRGNIAPALPLALPIRRLPIPSGRPHGMFRPLQEGALVPGLLPASAAI